MPKPALLALALALAAACAAPPRDAPDWRLSSIGGRFILTAADPSGVEVFSLACRLAGPELIVRVPGFMPVASNEEFALGADGVSWLLVADVVGRPPGATGVTATGPLTEGALDAIAAGGRISALYGTQRIGPLQPDPAVLAPFLAGCRALV
jgi:hypothetical protein